MKSRLNFKLLFYNLRRSFWVANTFAIPICLIRIDKGIYPVLMIYPIILPCIWLISLGVSILYYQYHILEIVEEDNKIKIKYINFVVERIIEPRIEDLRVEFLYNRGIYFLTFEAGLFFMRQWQNSDWTKQRLIETYNQLKSKGVRVNDHVFNKMDL